MLSLGLSLTSASSRNKGFDSAEYAAQAVHFDGMTELLKTGGLDTVATYSQLLLSFWIKYYDLANVPIATNSEGRFQIALQSNLVIDCFDADFNGDQVVGEAGIANLGWHHFVAAYDRANESLCKVFLDGVDVTGDNGFFNTGDPTLAEDPALFKIGKEDFISVFEMADFYLAFDQFLDLTNPSNVAKFIADGRLVDLGENGELPTGSPPTIFLSGDATSFAANRGTGGGFSVTGVLTDAETSPGEI